MNAIIYKCRICKQAPVIKTAVGMDGRPAINIRCRCRCYVWRCSADLAKKQWNQLNQPIQRGRP